MHSLSNHPCRRLLLTLTLGLTACSASPSADKKTDQRAGLTAAQVAATATVAPTTSTPATAAGSTAASQAQSLALAQIPPFSSTSAVTISWSGDDKGSYLLTLSHVADCSVVLSKTVVQATTRFSMPPLPDGTYYFCLDALGANGQMVTAANSGIKTTIDTTAPTVNAGGPYHTNASLMLAGAAGDLNLLSTTWSQVSGPGTVVFSKPGSPTSLVQADQDGTYQLALTAVDAAGNQAVSLATFYRDTVPPPQLAGFQAQSGLGQNGQINLSLQLPADTTDIDHIDIRESTGNAAPDCNSGTVIQTLTPLSVTTSWSTTTNAPGSVFSFRACVYDQAGNVISPPASAVANVVASSAALPQLSFVGVTGGALTLGQSANIVPTTLASNGAPITACGIKSGTVALPSGLTINPTTCAIGGIATVQVTATNFTLVAVNSAGTSAAANIVLSVSGTVPSLSFAGATGTTVTFGQAFSVSPTTLNAHGTTLSGCGIKSGTTALPTGLAIDAATCAISGTSAAAFAATTLTLVAANSSGSSLGATVTLQVNATAPSLSFTAATGGEVGINQTLTVTPTQLQANGAAITACAIKSGTTALPSGLTVDATTCVISGSSSQPVAAASYTLVAANSVGNSSDASVTLTIDALAPTLSYSSATGTYAPVNQAMSVSPSTLANNGAAISGCAVKSGTTALPAGLSVNATTCVISGTATAIAQRQTYTLNATNSIGSSADATVMLEIGAITCDSGTPYTTCIVSTTQNLLDSPINVPGNLEIAASGHLSMTSVNGSIYQDSFAGATIPSVWVADRNTWTAASGYVTTNAATQATRLVLTNQADTALETVTARIRVDSFTPGDGGRAGVALRMHAGDAHAYALTIHGDMNTVEFLNEYEMWGNSYTYNFQAGTWYWFKLTIDASSNLYGKVWPDGTSEPSGWPYFQSGWSNLTGGSAALYAGADCQEDFTDFSVNDATGAASQMTLTVGGSLTVDSGGVFAGDFTNSSAQALTVSQGATAQFSGSSFVANSMTIAGTMTNTTARLGASTFNLAATGTITANGAGYAGGLSGVNGGLASGPGGSAGYYYGAAGGSYGGQGGASSGSLGAAGTYGSSSQPTAPGSGGGAESASNGGNGGGAQQITVEGTATINGSISANGTNGSYVVECASGGGSGGAIWLSAGALVGSGSIAANGGDGGLGVNCAGGTSGGGGGGGGGGRIALYYGNSAFSGSVTVAGGAGGTGAAAGSSGSIYYAQAGANCALGTCYHTIFATQQAVSGSLANLAGLDGTCASAASAAGYPGTWMAVASDASNTAVGRLAISGLVMNPLGTVVAADGATFWSQLTNPVALSETLKWLDPQAPVWTGTTAAGSAASTCGNWSGTGSGTYGYAGASDGTWINAGTAVCSQASRLYCINQ